VSPLYALSCYLNKVNTEQKQGKSSEKLIFAPIFDISSLLLWLAQSKMTLRMFILLMVLWVPIKKHLAKSWISPKLSGPVNLENLHSIVSRIFMQPNSESLAQCKVGCCAGVYKLEPSKAQVLWTQETLGSHPITPPTYQSYSNIFSDICTNTKITMPNF